MAFSVLVVTRRVLLGAGLAALLLIAVGCGSGANSITGPSLGDNSNNSMLHGQYAFAFSGQSRTSGALISGVGMFTADGSGTISGGMEDANIGNGAQTFNFTGKYSVGADLRGTAILTGLPVCPNWQFSLINSSHALLTCFDTGNTASGSLDLQDTTAFSAAKLSGKYVFSMSGAGVNSSSAPLAAIAGQVTMDGVGTLTSGTMDVNDGFTLIPSASVTGTYTVASNGRGTLALHSNAYAGTQNFAFYIVNATDFKLLETDALTTSTPFVSGEALAAAASASVLNTANAGFVFTLGGLDVNGIAYAEGGVFTSNGAGALSSIIDVNDGGSTNLGAVTSGSYSIGGNGRVAMVLNSGFSSTSLAGYPAANGTWELVELDGNAVTVGIAKNQAAGSFGATTVSGNYALNWAGTLNPVPSLVSSPSEEDIAGRMSADGAGNFTGTLDINAASGLIQGVGLGSPSTYNVNTNGYGSAIINTQVAGFTMQVYQADPNTVLFLDSDPTRVLVGVMQK